MEKSWEKSYWEKNKDKRKKKKNRYVFGGYNYETGEQVGLNYDYDFDRKISGKHSKKDWDNDWNSYEKTGVWKGYSYYKKSTIDFRYIEQMAAIFSANKPITVKVGTHWALDLEKKELTYDPISLMTGTKANVISSLLHEIGHLLYTSHSKKLSSPYLKKYPQSAHDVLNMYEDFRIDSLTPGLYNGVSEILKGNKEFATEKISEMLEKSKSRKETIKNYLSQEKPKMLSEIGSMDKATKENVERIKQIKDKIDKIDKAKKEVDSPNLLDFYSGTYAEAYGIDVPSGTFSDELLELVNKTAPFIKDMEKADSTESLLKIVDKEVYPVIEDLLKNDEHGSKSMQEGLGKSRAKSLMNQANAHPKTSVSGTGKIMITPEQAGRTPSRMEGQELKGGGHNQNTKHLPQEWADGDYDALRQSVESSIKELVRKLRNLRSQELTPVWQKRKKRGRIDIKDIYRFKSGRMNIFKKKEINIDTISSFSFSLVVDISGSMDGEPIIHTTRGLIILAEVFNKLDIPFEIVVFGNNGRVLKKFNEKYDKKITPRVGNIVKMAREGTDIYSGVNTTTISKRPELNKTIVLLTDGQDDSNADSLIEELKDKHKVNTLGFYIGGSDDDYYQELIHDLVGENGKVIEGAHLVPETFVNTFKGLIKGKTKLKF